MNDFYNLIRGLEDDIYNEQFNDGVFSFCCSYSILEDWINQGNATYAGNFIEGVSLNNFVLFLDGAIAAVYEHCINCWSVDYLVKIAFDTEKPNKVMEQWDAFEAENQVNEDK